MIKFLVFSDQESSILRNDCNFKNKKPEDLDTNKKFHYIFNNIWEMSSTKT